jgi:hypothetical protein
LTLFITFCISSTVSAAEIQESNNNQSLLNNIIITPYTIFTISQVSHSVDENISVSATITFNDANNQIGAITNLQLDSYTSGVSNISIGNPVNMGNYAYCSVAYLYKGKAYSSICYFLPEFVQFVNSWEYNF